MATWPFDGAINFEPHLRPNLKVFKLIDWKQTDTQVKRIIQAALTEVFVE
jgi:hypothetical protein